MYNVHDVAVVDIPAQTNTPPVDPRETARKKKKPNNNNNKL
jgi:hypothetical protein